MAEGRMEEWGARGGSKLSCFCFPSSDFAMRRCFMAEGCSCSCHWESHIGSSDLLPAEDAVAHCERQDSRCTERVPLSAPCLHSCEAGERMLACQG